MRVELLSSTKARIVRSYFKALRNGASQESTRIESVVLDCATGIVRYHGEAGFAPGTWVGVELRGPTGGNNGTVRGRE
jgi:hypothetical protein